MQGGVFGVYVAFLLVPFKPIYLPEGAKTGKKSPMTQPHQLMLQV